MLNDIIMRKKFTDFVLLEKVHSNKVEILKSMLTLGYEKGYSHILSFPLIGSPRATRRGENPSDRSLARGELQAFFKERFRPLQNDGGQASRNDIYNTICGKNSGLDPPVKPEDDRP